MFISPTSIYAALAMTMAGCAGETREELIKVLGIPSELAESEVTQIIGSTLERYFWDVQGVTVEMANRLFVAASLGLKQQFSDELKTHFKAEPEKVTRGMHSIR